MYYPHRSRYESPANEPHDRTAGRRTPGVAALMAATLPLVVLAASFPAVSAALVVGVLAGAVGTRVA